jgi:hypothetical protein
MFCQQNTQKTASDSPTYTRLLSAHNQVRMMLQGEEKHQFLSILGSSGS